MKRLIAVLVATAATAAVAAVAASAAPPANTAIPTIEGNNDVPFVGDTLTATNGSWSGNPTSFTYQWDRCDAVGDRQNCTGIAGATAKTYKIQKADEEHTLRVRVTAKNADGSATKDSKGTGVVSDAKAPKNLTRPAVSGSANVGSTLTVSNGTWAGATSFAYQWQQCDQNGNNCSAIAGATGKTYGVRSGDVGHELRAEVTASNKFGSSKATSNLTAAVTAGGGTTTTTPAGACSAGALKPPQRLLIDRWTFSPSVITRSTGSFTARVHVIEANAGCSVGGAMIWSTAIPYNQTTTEQTTTGADGWATLTFTMKSGFPANPGRQQILAVLVRATQPGGSSLAGVSTRRVLAERVNLR